MTREEFDALHCARAYNHGRLGSFLRDLQDRKAIPPHLRPLAETILAEYDEVWGRKPAATPEVPA